MPRNVGVEHDPIFCTKGCGRRATFCGGLFYGCSQDCAGVGKFECKDCKKEFVIGQRKHDIPNTYNACPHCRSSGPHKSLGELSDHEAWTRKWQELDELCYKKYHGYNNVGLSISTQWKNFRSAQIYLDVTRYQIGIGYGSPTVNAVHMAIYTLQHNRELLKIDGLEPTRWVSKPEKELALARKIIRDACRAHTPPPA